MRGAWHWFTACRRTRPFWGGLLLIVAGLEIIQLMSSSLAIAVGGGWNTSAGYILGGGLIVFGLCAWFTPYYSKLVGLLGVLVALAAFVGANLGGLLVGTILGIVGGSMVWAWGEKAPKRARRAGRRSTGRTRSNRVGTTVEAVSADAPQ